MKIRRALVCAPIVATLCAAAAQDAPQPPALPTELQNAGFESGEPGKSPPGWFAGPEGARAEISLDNALEGRACLALAAAPHAAPNNPMRANLTQIIDAAPYRGKRVELLASVRFEGDGNAQMWFRVDRPGGAMGFFDNMADRPIKAQAWATYAIRGDVDDDATDLAVGFFLINGAGRAWIDGVTLRVVGPANAGSIAPAPLSPRATDNLVALARLLGVLRYFHPATETESLDWDDYTIRAVQDVEGAATPAQLAERLNAWTVPIAPTIRVWAGPPDIVPTIPGKPQNATHIVGMRYLGYALPQAKMAAAQKANIYSARRVREPLARDDAKREIPPPGTTVTIDLGAGVRAIVPVTLYADAGRTLPEAAAKFPDTPARPDSWSPSAKDRATRLAAICLAWGALRHFYPYFDVTPDDWDAALPPALESAARDKGPEDFYRTLGVMLAHLHDGHGYVGGPGAPVRAIRDFAWTWAGDELVVSAVAASQTLLKPGDVILEIEGKRVPDLYAHAAAAICAATEQWCRARALNDMGWTAGPGNVSLVIRRAGAELGLNVPRTSAPKPFQPPLPADGSEVAPGILYFNLDRAETAALMTVWPKLLQAKGVIFDLRGYPGSAGAMLLPYLSDQPLQSAKWNVPVLTMPNFEKVTFEKSNWNLPPQQPRLTGQIAFLTGGGAISYAESCMGIVENYKLGEIVGGPTAGTNGNITSVKLPGGYSLTFTGMKVLKHDGSRHHGVGIQPTVPAAPTVAGLAAGRDEVLDKAVEVLKAKIEKAAEEPSKPAAK